jgi:protein-disulfide isomerase
MQPRLENYRWTNDSRRTSLVTAKLIVCLSVASIFMSHISAGQTNEEADEKIILREIRELRTEVSLLQNDLRQVKALLKAEPAATPPTEQDFTNIVLDVKGRTFRGNKNAKLAVVEFFDYECPYCRRFAHDEFPKIQDQYINSGKIKYYFFNYPLPSHHSALAAARGVLCANDGGKFWEMHERLFTGQGTQDLAVENLVKLARELKLDETGFRGCLNAGQHADEVERDVSYGRKAGLRGIPCFLFGVTDPEDEHLEVLRIVNGSRPFGQFKEILDDMLSSPDGGVSPDRPPMESMTNIVLTHISRIRFTSQC